MAGQFAKVTPQVRAHCRQQRGHPGFSKWEEGPKVKVGKINFKGNHAFQRFAKLIRAMRHDRPVFHSSLFLETFPVLSKTYDREKALNEDLGGWLAAASTRIMATSRQFCGDPILENIDTTGFPAWAFRSPAASHGKAVNITNSYRRRRALQDGLAKKSFSADPDKSSYLLRSMPLGPSSPLKTATSSPPPKSAKAMQDYTQSVWPIRLHRFHRRTPV